MSIASRRFILGLGVVMMVMLSGCATRSLHYEPRSVSPGDFQLQLTRLKPGDVVDITDRQNRDYTVNVTEVGETYLEGYAFYPGNSAPEWWPTRHSFSDMKTLDGVIVPDEFAFYQGEEEPGGAGETASRAAVEAGESSGVDADGASAGAESAVPQAHDADPAYVALTASMNKGDVVDVVTRSGDRFLFDLAEIGADYIAGYRIEAGGSGGDALSRRYEMKELQSIDGVPVPIDLARFRVGDRIEVRTVAGETIRLVIDEVNRNGLKGERLADGSAGENPSPVVLRRDEIASGKIYLTRRQKANKVARVVGEGVKALALAVLAIGVFALLLLVELGPYYYR